MNYNICRFTVFHRKTPIEQRRRLAWMENLDWTPNISCKIYGAHFLSGLLHTHYIVKLYSVVLATPSCLDLFFPTTYQQGYAMFVNLFHCQTAKFEHFLGIRKVLYLGIKAERPLTNENRTEDWALGSHPRDNGHVTH